MIPTSVLTKDQNRTFGPRQITYHNEPAQIKVSVRFDDRCNNGHNTFSITGEIYKVIGEFHRWMAGGCLHDEIAKAFPELAPYIKWHLCSTDGPMHGIANTLYHVLEHGPNYAWVYWTGKIEPLLSKEKEHSLGYFKADEVEAVKSLFDDKYRIEWDQKTVKTRNLAHARSSAIWPEATDEELTSPDLKERLEKRMPALLEEFHKAMTEFFGFTW